MMEILREKLTEDNKDLKKKEDKIRNLMKEKDCFLRKMDQMGHWDLQTMAKEDRQMDHHSCQEDSLILFQEMTKAEEKMAPEDQCFHQMALEGKFNRQMGKGQATVKKAKEMVNRIQMEHQMKSLQCLHRWQRNQKPQQHQFLPLRLIKERVHRLMAHPFQSHQMEMAT
jgi:hypothetical protein